MRQKVRQREAPSRAEASQQAAVHRLEGRGDGLHREGQAVEHGSDDQAFEGEGQAVSGDGLKPASEGAVRAKRNQQVKAQHRGRQDDGQRNHGFNQEAAATAGERQPVAER